MNRMYVAVFCVLLLIALGFTYQVVVQNASEALLSVVDEMDTLITSESWTTMQEKLPELYHTFDRNRKILNSLLDHEEVGPLHVLMAKMMAYARQKKSDEYLVESASLRAQLMLLPKRDKFSFDNLL